MTGGGLLKWICASQLLGDVLETSGIDVGVFLRQSPCGMLLTN